MLKRLSLGAVGGGVVTIGLGLAMMNMIAADFEAQDKLPTLHMDINPVDIDPVLPPPEIELLELKHIETPPPPPIIDREDAKLPSEPLAKTGIDLPKIVKPTIGVPITIIAISDRDAQPITRIEPKMPLRADRSGHCMVKFDVSAQGKPFNVITTYCSQALFERPSIKAVHKWTYQPKVQGGKPIARKNVITRMSFNLLDPSGKIIPE